MNTYPCLSIIIPVYNASKYLSGCIESILNQSYRDFELILVNDGSADTSGDVCDEYAQKDSRIKVIHKPNGGVSSARNTGIAVAKGKYLTFVDADDTVEPDIYDVMIDGAEQHGVDYVICGYNEVCGHKIIPRLFSLPDNTVMNRDGVISKLISSIYTGESIINSPCNKLYKRELIERYKIEFPKRRRAEDWLFNIAYVEIAQSAIYINRPLYNYVRNEQSAMSRVLPDQYLLWKENALIKRELAERYQLPVDWKEVNKLFLEGVIPWIMSMYKQDKTFRFNTVFEDNEFVDACKNSHPLEGNRIEFVRKMINASFQGLARLLCMI